MACDKKDKDYLIIAYIYFDHKGKKFLWLGYL
jgi:hypothetical protein